MSYCPGHLPTLCFILLYHCYSVLWKQTYDLLITKVMPCILVVMFSKIVYSILLETEAGSLLIMLGSTEPAAMAQ